MQLMNHRSFDHGTLLITGGTGSFGHAVLTRFLNTNIAEIRIFSRDEKKQDDMRRAIGSPKLRFYIGDVRDYDSVDAAMEGVDFVFHAAALKQVPSCEFYPMEAVRTNIVGADNVLKAAVAHRVKKAIVLSTDKAVYPINAMGMTKALMEKLMVARSRLVDPAVTTLSATRYGNVMASRGSVIPLFVQLIEEGSPLTITDPSMTRFLLSLEDAVDLVLYAFEHAETGDVFVRKAPACTVMALADALKELLNADNPIEIIGTRHGEKVFETLVNREEMAKAVDMGDYYRIPADTRDLNYGMYFSNGEERISNADDYTSHSTRQLTVEEVKGLVRKLPVVSDAIGRRRS